MHPIIKNILKDYKLNENDCYILDYIISHLNEIHNYSARRLAKETYTQPMNISRLARKLGFHNYENFRYNIVHFIGTYMVNETAIKKDDSPISTLIKAAEIEQSVITETKGILDTDLLQKIVHLLAQTTYIDIYANDANKHIAEYISHYFSSAGKIVNIISEIDMLFYHSQVIDQTHIVLIFSKQGQNKYFQEALQLLSNKGIKSILLTSRYHNPLEHFTTYTIHTIYEPSLQFGNMIYHSSLKFILDVLYLSLVSLDYDKKIKLESLHQTLYDKHK